MGTQDRIHLSRSPDDLPESIEQTFATARLTNSPGLATPAETIATWNVSGESLTSRTISSHSVPSVGRSAAPEDLPKVSGPSFLLQRPIARGGMGEVWEAWQVSLGRTVAIKRVRDDAIPDVGDGDPEWSTVFREFLQEGRVSAQLEHPNIVPVYDFGLDPDGRPMLAMKLVKGRPWNSILKADLEALSTADLLAKHLPILVDVAHAVAFAHSHRIVHRDLKPGQVMIGEFGEVLLMDWGLAVCMEGEGDSASVPFPQDIGLPTRITASSPSGTPALMAPEQTRSDASAIGPWTDLFLLGGTLYFILTGTYPHHAPTSAMAMERARDGNVEPPETRAPKREIPPELSALAMHCLRRDPKERLQEGMEFATALQDWLSGSGKRRESVELARDVESKLSATVQDYAALNDLLSNLSRALMLWPENAPAAHLHEDVLERYARSALSFGDLKLARLQAERLQKGDRRKKLLQRVEEGEDQARTAARQRRLALRAAAALALTIIVGGTIFTLRLSAANDRIQKQNERIILQRNSGEEVMAFMLGDLSPKLHDVGRLSLLRGVAERTLKYYDDMESDDSDFSAGRTRSTAIRQVGEVLEAEGNVEDAIEAFQTSERILRELIRISTGTNRDTARSDHGSIQISLGGAYLRQGRYDEARKCFEEAESIFRVLVEEFPDFRSRMLRGLGAAFHGFGSIERERGSVEKSLQYFEEHLKCAAEAHQLEPGDVDTSQYYANALSRVGIALRQMGNLTRAFSIYEQEIAIREELLAREPNSLRLLAQIASTYFQIAEIALDQGDFEKADVYLRKNRDTRKSLHSADPLNTDWEYEYARAELEYGSFLLNSDREEQALRSLEDARVTFDRIVNSESSTLNWAIDRSGAYSRITDFYFFSGDYEKALEWSKKTIAIRQEIYEKNPESMNAASAYAVSVTKGAQFHYQLGDMVRALELFEASKAIWDILIETDPSNANYRWETANRLVWEGGCLMHLGRFDEALERLFHSRAIMEELVALDPTNDFFSSTYFQSGATITAVYEQQGKPEEAMDLARNTTEVFRGYHSKNPNRLELGLFYSNAGRSYVNVLIAAGHKELAAQELIRLTEDLSRLWPQFTDSYNARASHISFAEWEARAWARLGNKAQSREAMERVLLQHQEMVQLVPDSLQVKYSYLSFMASIVLDIIEQGDVNRARSILESGAPLLEKAVNPMPEITDDRTAIVRFVLCRGQFRLLTGDVDRAVPDFTQALEILEFTKPDTPEEIIDWRFRNCSAQVGLGLSRMEQGQSQAALDGLESAITFAEQNYLDAEMEPLSAAPFLQMIALKAVLLDSLGRADEARATAESAAPILNGLDDPNIEFAYVALNYEMIARTHFILGNREKAVETALEYQSLNVPNAIFFRWARENNLLSE